jgi:hypothetical protein
MTGIGPAFSAWEADVLPLNYIRVGPMDLGFSLRLSVGFGGLPVVLHQLDSPLGLHDLGSLKERRQDWFDMEHRRSIDRVETAGMHGPALDAKE